MDYAREFANTTLISQQEFALAFVSTNKNISYSSVGESIELKKLRVIEANRLAATLIKYNFNISQAKILEAKKLALLNGEAPGDIAAIEEEARLHLIALNLTAQAQLILVAEALNNSIADIVANDNGVRFCLSNGTNCNLTNYALKNQSETFTGNITTNQTGFFGWLGSLTNRITKLWVQDIDAINIKSNNISSDNYFSKNLSGITNNSFKVCRQVQGNACLDWCNLTVTSGIITGCG